MITLEIGIGVGRNDIILVPGNKMGCYQPPININVSLPVTEVYAPKTHILINSRSLIDTASTLPSRRGICQDAYSPLAYRLQKIPKVLGDHNKSLPATEPLMM